LQQQLVLNLLRLRRSAEDSAGAYSDAKPFPHAILDSVFEDRFLAAAADRFPGPEDIAWYEYNNPFEQKLATNRIEDIPPEILQVMGALNCRDFVAALEVLTGIPGLMPDPEYIGGGLHMITPGGKLDVHADFNYHPITNLHRRVNVILFLNRDWRPEYGGCLEFWDAGLSGPAQRILPQFNRLVIFSVNDLAYHGSPERLNCPAHVTRKSVATYYYTRSRPENEQSPAHSTLYKRRPTDPYDPAVERLREQRAVKRLADAQKQIGATREASPYRRNE